MKTVQLGQTGVAVTRLGLGLAPIAGLYSAVGDDAAYATIEAAWDAGVRFFDTAPLYGHGLSERRTGHVLSSYPRSSFTLSTTTAALETLRLVSIGSTGEWRRNASTGEPTLRC